VKGYFAFFYYGIIALFWLAYAVVRLLLLVLPYVVAALLLIVALLTAPLRKLKKHGGPQAEPEHGALRKASEQQRVASARPTWIERGLPFPPASRTISRSVPTAMQHNQDPVNRANPGRPPFALPARVTQRWIESTVPTLTASEFSALKTALRGRGWTNADMASRVIPHARI
jgi:hypothetical protein